MSVIKIVTASKDHAREEEEAMVVDDGSGGEELLPAASTSLAASSAAASLSLDQALTSTPPPSSPTRGSRPSPSRSGGGFSSSPRGSGGRHGSPAPSSLAPSSAPLRLRPSDPMEMIQQLRQQHARALGQGEVMPRGLARLQAAPRQHSRPPRVLLPPRPSLLASGAQRLDRLGIFGGAQDAAQSVKDAMACLEQASRSLGPTMIHSAAGARRAVTAAFNSIAVMREDFNSLQSFVAEQIDEMEREHTAAIQILHDEVVTKIENCQTTVNTMWKSNMDYVDRIRQEESQIKGWRGKRARLLQNVVQQLKLTKNSSLSLKADCVKYHNETAGLVGKVVNHVDLVCNQLKDNAENRDYIANQYMNEKSAHQQLQKQHETLRLKFQQLQADGASRDARYSDTMAKLTDKSVAYDKLRKETEQESKQLKWVMHHLQAVEDTNEDLEALLDESNIRVPPEIQKQRRHTPRRQSRVRRATHSHHRVDNSAVGESYGVTNKRRREDDSANREHESSTSAGVSRHASSGTSGSSSWQHLQPPFSLTQSRQASLHTLSNLGSSSHRSRTHPSSSSMSPAGSIRAPASVPSLGPPPKFHVGRPATFAPAREATDENSMD